MLATLLQSSYFALFLIIAIGFVIGRIEVKGLSLDVSAVIFIALIFGHFGVIIPKDLGNLGLVLFIYTIGIQAGPGFFDSFRSKGKTLIFLTLLLIGSAALTGIAAKFLFHVDTPSIVGLMAGALTSTPGLAVAIDTTGSAAASIAYGIAYPFGVIGVILVVKLLPKILRKDINEEAKKLDGEKNHDHLPLHTATFRITNDHVFGKTLAQLEIRSMTGAVVSRIQHGETTSLPTPQTVLNEGDLIKAVGTERSIEQLYLLVGEKLEKDLPLVGNQQIQSMLVTNKNVMNKSLAFLNVQGNFNCTVTRVRRSGIDLSPEPSLTLKLGDKLLVAGEAENLKDFGQMIGNDEKKLSDTDLFPIALGIVLGVLFGQLNLSFSDSFSFSPGLTGGILIMALFLSALGKTGPFLWSMSGNANQLLRQIGLLLFLAEVGTSAGKNLVSTFQESGFTLFFIGMALTIVPMIVAILAAKFLFKINILDLIGSIAGGMTSTPGLAAADSMCDSSAPSIAYATVYPIAMIFLILAIQFITIVFP